VTIQVKNDKVIATMSCGGNAQLLWSVHDVENTFQWAFDYPQSINYYDNALTVDVTDTLQNQGSVSTYTMEMMKYQEAYINAGGSFTYNPTGDLARELLYGGIANSWDRRITGRHVNIYID
jgi:hypothetical protein